MVCRVDCYTIVEECCCRCMYLELYSKQQRRIEEEKSGRKAGVCWWKVYVIDGCGNGPGTEADGPS